MSENFTKEDLGKIFCQILKNLHADKNSFPENEIHIRVKVTNKIVKNVISSYNEMAQIKTTKCRHVSYSKEHEIYTARLLREMWDGEKYEETVTYFKDELEC